MTSAKNYKEKKTEQERGRKRYLERLIEKQEAEKEIQEYENSEDGNSPDRLDGDRLEYRQRSEGKFP
jgi:hypothetical protein